MRSPRKCWLHAWIGGAFAAVAALGGSACGSSPTVQTLTTQSQSTPAQSTPAQSTPEGSTPTKTPVEPVLLTFDTWQAAAMWERTIDTFELAHPGVTIEVRASDPAEYDADIETRVDADALGDIVACRGFDWALKHFTEGSFASLSALDGMDRFSPLDTAAWTTDDGDETFCVPVAAVTHAIAYNADILNELGIAVPTTAPEFQTALETVASDGRYVPFAIGLDPARSASTMVWFMTGAQFWQGEKGRLGLISRAAKLTDEPFVASLRQLEALASTFATNPAEVARIDAIDGFIAGTAAFIPVGSWETSWLGSALEFEVGFMPAPVGPSGQCYSVEHSDVGLALNAHSENRQVAEQFLSWVTTSEFAEAFFTEKSGFVSLQRDAPEPPNPTLREFLSASDGCEPTERLPVQMLSRGDIDLTDASGEVISAVMSGALSAEDAAQQMQDALEKGYGAATN